MYQYGWFINTNLSCSFRFMALYSCLVKVVKVQSITSVSITLALNSRQGGTAIRNAYAEVCRCCNLIIAI